MNRVIDIINPLFGRSGLFFALVTFLCFPAGIIVAITMSLYSHFYSGLLYGSIAEFTKINPL
ncbi:hypothetical protein Xszus_00401 [Xenorhabdus szentirmaii]|nr:hypothetical protein Xsze_03704 [Xenorhabdus szentirmaii DSM 16338]PHM40728.1 hypothetical protein Xszus_00401 [Xenorhabdus szentirmaii]